MLLIERGGVAWVHASVEALPSSCANPHATLPPLHPVRSRVELALCLVAEKSFSGSWVSE